MKRSVVPEGYAPIAEAARVHDETENAVYLLARRGRVRAVKIRHRVYVSLPDLEALYTPKPYPPAAA